MRYNQNLQNSMKVPFEFQPGTLEFLNCLLTGLAYMCILNILLETGQGKMSDDDLASLESEIARNLSVVKDSIKTNSNLKKYFGYLLDDATSKYYEFSINALVRMANAFEAKHNEAKTKGYIGIQIAYLLEAQNVIKYMDKDSFPDKKALMKKYEGLNKRIDEAKLMNDQVYNAPILPRDQLNHIKPIEQKVRPIEPKNIRIPPKDAQFFSNFRSEEMDTVRSSLGLFITNKKQHIEKTIFDLKEKFNDICKQYNIQFLKSCANLGDTVCNEDFRKKVNSIREKGEKGYTDLVTLILQQRKSIDEAFRKIDIIVEREIEKDKQALQVIQNGQYTTYVQAFGDQIANINNMKTNTRGYRVMDEKITTMFESFKNFLPRVANKSIDPKDLVKVPDIEELTAKNGEALAQLAKLYMGIDQLINTHVTNDEKEILQILNEIDVDNYSQKITMNEKTMEAIYVEINERLGPKTQGFEEKVSKVYGPLDKLKDIAQKIISANPKITQNSLNDLLLGIDFFYVKLQITLGLLSKIV
jgi:hypothetical protein